MLKALPNTGFLCLPPTSPLGSPLHNTQGFPRCLSKAGRQKADTGPHSSTQALTAHLGPEAGIGNGLQHSFLPNLDQA